MRVAPPRALVGPGAARADVVGSAPLGQPADQLRARAVELRRAGRINATDHAVLVELVRRHPPELAPPVAVTAGELAQAIGKARSTVAESLRHLRRAGLVEVRRRYHAGRYGAIQDAPTYRFFHEPTHGISETDTRHDSDTRCKVDARAEASHLKHLRLKPQRLSRAGSETEPPPPASGRREPDTPTRVDPAEILAYAERLRVQLPTPYQAVAASSAKPGPGGAANGPPPKPDNENEGEPMPTPTTDHLDVPMSDRELRAVRLAVVDLLEIVDELCLGLSAGAQVPAEWAARSSETLIQHRNGIGFPPVACKPGDIDESAQ